MEEEDRKEKIGRLAAQATGCEPHFKQAPTKRSIFTARGPPCRDLGGGLRAPTGPNHAGIAN